MQQEEGFTITEGRRSVRERVAWQLGRAAAIITWPVRAPVVWFLGWKTQSKCALAGFIFGLALAWVAGVDFTERHPGVAFAVFYSSLIALVVRILPYEDFTS